jgi:nucleotidyltransferase AbiEii toxin of type IV toxin-antitoxin system
MAGPLKLHEHRDFRDLIVRVARERGVAEAWVEKDYYVSEVLRLVAQTYPTQTMLKGGTSLSKGWLILDRISEDIDLFLDPTAFPPAKGRRIIGQTAIDKKFKQLRDAVNSHPALTLDAGESITIGGRGRTDRFAYQPLFANAGFTIAPSVLLEAGIQSGSGPRERRRISSLIAEYARRAGQGAMADDTTEFELPVLHFRRTFVEKLFTVHGKVARFREDGTRLGRSARHYADLYVLADTPEVTTMLLGAEYEEIRRDYDEKSRAFYSNSYRPPANLRFDKSPAFFPDGALRKELEADYEQDVRPLFFGGTFPPFADVLDRLGALRDVI